MSTVSASETGSIQRQSDREVANRRAVRIWLYVVLVVLFSLFLVGGGTRLTDSGLSITEWKPIHGVIPPLNEAEWQEELAKYREIPQYQQINKGMSLEDFKTIFWWEWAHRLIARLVGLVMALPLAYFWLSGRLERHLKPKLLGLLALGGFQGFVGWWMVTSGLSERTEVSQYRLATHLLLACVIFTLVMWVARGLAAHSAGRSSDTTRKLAVAMVLLILLQIGLGALVAGLDAGMAYNTWPLMDGAVVPGDLLIRNPWWINFFENPKTVQFTHRIGAYVLLAVALWHALSARKLDAGTPHATRAMILLALVLVQAALGIGALVHVVPFSWALTHHGFAIVTLAFAVAHARATVGPYPPQTRVIDVRY
ncbi:MAG: COX15/CtaA family protein [Mesorhizobium sp.]